MPPRHDKTQGLAQYADGSWGVDCYIFGRRVRRKVGTITQARTELARLKHEELEGRVNIVPRSVRRTTMSEWVDAYLVVARGKTNAYFAERWRELVGPDLPEQVTVKFLRAWVRARIDDGKAPASIHREIDVLSAIFSEALRSGEITERDSPFLDTRALGLPKINNLRETCFTPQDQARLAECLGEWWWPYAEFSLITAMRFGSMAKMDWPCINWVDRVAMLWTPKSGYRQPISLSDRAIFLLKQQKTRYPDCQWCWPSKRGSQLNKDHFRNRVWRKAFNMAGLADATWHDCRHTAASILVREGEDLYTVQQVLGQSDPRVTQRYAHIGMSRQRSAIERLSSVMDPSIDPSIPGP